MTAAFYQNEVKFFIAVDCIILGFNSGELNVLLYKRNFEPLKGQWSLMGGFIKSGESLTAVCEVARLLFALGGIRITL